MSKYSERFKLKVIRQYLSGPAGYKAVAKEHDLSHSMVVRWVASFQQHGQNGLAKKSVSYSAQFKLAVLQHMWREGLSYGQTAIHFDIRSQANVGLWERQYHSGGIDALAPRPRGRPKTINWLRVSQGCQICLKSFVGMTFADFRRDPLEFPIFGGR